MTESAAANQPVVDSVAVTFIGWQAALQDPANTQNLQPLHLLLNNPLIYTEPKDKAKR